ncbi:MAG: hypothetical protein KME26_27850 [Oscillatoria princeps RMCB-10]|jgi:tetratricopeptide (TPR) repeat protein|nr:hypothetical protein [Oscillatoria princeps RMCB-10]
MVFQDSSNQVDSWVQQAHEYLVSGAHTKAVSIYEKAIEADPSVKSNYWYLGLMLLLQGQEAEAHTTWLMGMVEGEPEQVEEWTSELIQVLQTEAERREALADYSVVWTIRQHIREIAPTDINNLLQILLLSINLNTFTSEDLTALGIIDLLCSESFAVNAQLLFQVLQKVLAYAPHEQSVLEFANVCQRYAPEAQELERSVMFASAKIGERQSPERDAIKYSYLDEERIIDNFLSQLNIENRYCVDIAASDGITMSNTYFLFKRGWGGLAVEYDSHQFAKLAIRYAEFESVNLSKCMVTPENAISLLKAHQAPENFTFLNLDIDGYDYFVLEKILSSFRPLLLCVEINEKIPPPIKFTVKWSPNYSWNRDHFYGQSLSQLNLLCVRHEYALVDLHYNNAFLIPREISPSPSLTPEEAYRKGYLERDDRKEKFPWNANMEEIHSLSPVEALNYVSKFFSKYGGQFICNL